MRFVQFFMWLSFFLYVWRAWRNWRRWLEAARRAAPIPPPQAHFHAAARGAATPVRAPTPYEILGVAPGASAAAIRKAYQQAVQAYHPDHVAHLGVELREVAERRTKEITAAYNVLKKTAAASPKN